MNFQFPMFNQVLKLPTRITIVGVAYHTLFIRSI